MNIERYAELLNQFAEERDWRQFHSPKNLTTALMCEAAELAEIFQWMTTEQSEAVTENSKLMKDISHEIADVQLYLIRLANILNIDIEKSVQEKLAINARKYPIDLAKGNSTKYSRRED